MWGAKAKHPNASEASERHAASLEEDEEEEEEEEKEEEEEREDEVPGEDTRAVQQTL